MVDEGTQLRLQEFVVSPVTDDAERLRIDTSLQRVEQDLALMRQALVDRHRPAAQGPAQGGEGDSATVKGSIDQHLADERRDAEDDGGHEQQRHEAHRHLMSGCMAGHRARQDQECPGLEQQEHCEPEAKSVAQSRH